MPVFHNKTALRTPVRRSGLPENQGTFFPPNNWARPLDVQGFRKIQRQFPLTKQPWAYPLDVQGVQEFKKPFSTKQKPLEYRQSAVEAWSALLCRHPDKIGRLSTEHQMSTWVFSGECGTHNYPLGPGFQTAWLTSFHEHISKYISTLQLVCQHTTSLPMSLNTWTQRKEVVCLHNTLFIYALHAMHTWRLCTVLVLLSRQSRLF